MKIFIHFVFLLLLSACGSGNQANENLNAQTSIEAGSNQASNTQYQMRSVVSTNLVEGKVQRSNNYVLRNGSIL